MLHGRSETALHARSETEVRLPEREKERERVRGLQLVILTPLTLDDYYFTFHPHGHRYVCLLVMNWHGVM